MPLPGEPIELPPSSHEVSIERSGEPIVVKRYRQWNRGEPHREWSALQLLHRHAPGLAPRPISAELDGEPPVVRMQYLPGRPLGGAPLTDEQLAGIVVALDRLHRSVPASLLGDLPFADSDPAGRAASLERRLRAQARPAGDPLVATAYDAAISWLGGSAASALTTATAEPVLARGDHNLPNFLYQPGGVRLVDFENSGRGDRCTEIAEVLEHISARSTPDPTWDAFLNRLTLTREERRRLAAARCLAGIFWLLMLLPGQPGHDRNPPDALARQARRLLGHELIALLG